MFYVAQEIMHQVALVPMVVMLALLGTARFNRVQWLVSCALALSWLMDSTNFIAMRVGEPIADTVTQYGAPLQVGLVLIALVPGKVFGKFLAGLAVLTAVSALQGFNGREAVVPVVGGFVITLYAWDRRDKTLEQGVIVYFGIGAVTWLAWAVAASAPTTTALVTWSGYQLTRLAGISLITAALIAHARKPRLELV